MACKPTTADDERAAVERQVREFDLAELDREIALSVMDDADVRRLMTITGVNLTVAVGIVAAIGDIGRFSSPKKLVSYFGLNPRVRQSGLGNAHHGRISKVGRSHARATWSRMHGRRRRRPGRCMHSSSASAPGGVTRSRQWRSRAS